MELTNQNKKIRRSVSFDNMMYGKVPPQAKELEEVILGGLMIDVGAVFIGMSRLFPEIFYVDAHQRIFKAIQTQTNHHHWGAWYDRISNSKFWFRATRNSVG